MLLSIFIYCLEIPQDGPNIIPYYSTARFFLIYLCVWSIKYLESLIKEFLSNNCKLVCPLDPKLEINYLCLYNIGAIKIFYISAVLSIIKDIRPEPFATSLALS